MERSRIAINPHPGQDELTVLFAGESATFPRHAIGPRIHDYYLIHFVLSGKGRFVSRGKQYRLSAGESFFIFPDEVVSYESDEQDPWRYRWIALRGAAAPRLMDMLNVSPDKPVAVAANPRKTAADYRKMIRCLEQGGAGSDLQASGYARLILAGYIRGSETFSVHNDNSIARKQVEQAMRYMSLQYQQPLSIEHIAQESGYHRTHFCKIFKQVTGVSPYQYLTLIRMNQAARLLKERLPVQQVASAVGYSDPLYFSKQFRKHYGMPPSRYIHEHPLSKT